MATKTILAQIGAMQVKMYYNADKQTGLTMYSVHLKNSFSGGVAQRLEQRNHNPRVGGSIPPPATKYPFIQNR